MLCNVTVLPQQQRLGRGTTALGVGEGALGTVGALIGFSQQPAFTDEGTE